jgi:hypothetical protein
MREIEAIRAEPSRHRDAVVAVQALQQESRESRYRAILTTIAGALEQPGNLHRVYYTTRRVIELIFEWTPGYQTAFEWYRRSLTKRSGDEE